MLGNEGYLGLLDENKLPRAVKTNFTCRASRERNLKIALFRDICRYFEMSDDERQKLSDLSLRVVTEAYSSEKMADDTLRFYNETIYKYKAENPPKVAICGYYGRGNFGDETILKVILDCIKNQNQYASACIVTPQNPFLCLKNLCRADLFVFGGGSLLQNATSNSSLAFYLSIINTANLLCRRKIMLSNGIGPIRFKGGTNPFFESALLHSINTFDLISVRDSISKNKLKVLLPNRKIFHLPDPALIEFSHASKSTHYLHKPLCAKDYFAFCPHSRALKNSNISANAIVKALENISQKYSVRPVIAVLNKRDDLALARILQKNIKCDQTMIFTNPDEMASVFGGAKFVISQRYHGALLALSCNIPTLSLSQDPKMYGLSRDFGSAAPALPQILSNPALMEEILQKALSYHEKHSKEIQTKTKILTQRAEKIRFVLNS